MDELANLKYKYTTAKILVAVLLVSFILLGIMGIREEVKFNKEMEKCNENKAELVKYQELFTPTNKNIFDLTNG